MININSSKYLNNFKNLWKSSILIIKTIYILEANTLGYTKLYNLFVIKFIKQVDVIIFKEFFIKNLRILY